MGAKIAQRVTGSLCASGPPYYCSRQFRAHRRLPSRLHAAQNHAIHAPARNELTIQVALSQDRPKGANYIWGELPRISPPAATTFS